MTKRYNIPIKKSPDSDPQQYLLYRMENEAIGGRHTVRLTQVGLRRYVRGLTKAYDSPPVKIVFRDLGRWAAEWEEPDIITFGMRPASRDILTAAHEFAHHIHHWLAEGRDQQGHGKEFMACYLSVLDTSRLIPVVGMRAICEEYGIEFADPGTKNSIYQLRKAVRG